ncbi:uncharacterized protein SOCE26_011120 [Sorangium cellulosum]|uniref:Secreted protein n=1 Tax=Sorangium cellulosum TaxID=56 RepID=A0A2L0EK86_SORCE|nr:hypothetical protein [Sorangium cellulosum]AUX39717.1 uncharacterized protein SOCE26_011120 [Sorangium cellulosum]
MRQVVCSLAIFSWIGAIAGCGNVAVDGRPSDAGSGGSGGGTDSAASSSSSSNGSSGGEEGCFLRQDTSTLTLTLETHEGKTLGCTGGFREGDGDVVLQGQVVEVGDTSVLIESCPPDHDCVPMRSKLSLSEPGLLLAVTEGALVELRMFAETPMGCGARLLLMNLPSWGGIDNPVDPSSALLLAAADGLDTTFPESPFLLYKELGCTTEFEGSRHEVYLFRFMEADLPDARGVFVPQGEERVWASSSSALGSLRIRNLRSYESGLPDDFWNWAYWIVPDLSR